MLLKYEVEQTPGASRPYSFVIKKQGAPSHELAADTEESASRWSTVIREAVERNNQVRLSLLELNFSKFSRIKKPKNRLS